MNALAADPITLAYHELRAPLGLVATAARSLVEDSQDESVRDRCAVIARTAERMLRTSRQVVNVARTADTATVELYDPVQVLDDLCRDLHGFGVPIDVQATAHALGMQVFGPRASFEALVHSLIGNALDHSEPDGAVRAVVDVAADAVLVTISNAAGRRRHEGLGVGTYLCRRLAEQLGSTVTTELDGETYRATVRLPLGARCGDPALPLG
jgi:signal transduction histidine kinase